jgi:hypothetical protein
MSAQHETLTLGNYINHVVAPNWFLCAKGHNAYFGAVLACPVCGSAETRISTNSPTGNDFIVSRPECSDLLATAGKSVQHSDDPTQCMGVAIPMECAAGHEWQVSIEQSGDGPPRFCVLLTDGHYDATYPEERERWDGVQLWPFTEAAP